MGSFSIAITHLKKSGLFDALIHAANGGKNLLGICLGLQMFFENGDEGGSNKGLGLLKGQILPLEKFCTFDVGYKIPVMGWYKLDWHIPKDDTDFSKVINTITDEHMYFAHSFGVVPENKNVEICTLNYFNSRIIASIKEGNIFGTQFHPEKSGEAGLKVLRAFVS